jgi:tetratricopeptide (TPR) repeat protein
MDEHNGSNLPALNENAHISQARKLIQNDQEDEALRLVRQVLKVNMNNLDALLLYAQISPDNEKAIKALKRVLEIDPKNTDAKLQLRNLQRVSISSSKSDSALEEVMMQNRMLMNEVRRQQSTTPVINIVNTNTAVANGLPMVRQNTVAFWIGAVAAFFGLFGISHIMTGKLLSGVAWLIIGGPIFLFLIYAFALGTGGIGLLCAIPLHLVGAYQHAKQGSRIYD